MRGNFLIAISIFLAADSFLARFFQTKSTGRLARVYFAPRPELCVETLAVTSVDMPAYNESSEQRTM